MDKRQTPGLYNYLSFFYNTHNKLINKIIVENQLDLSLTEYLVMWNIVDYKETSQYELSKITGYTPARINQAVQSLHGNNYLEKLADYSSKIKLIPTDSGLEIIEFIQEKSFEYLKYYISEDDFANLEELYPPLKRFSSSLAKNPKFRNL
ncbi:MAG: hypothetical protein PQJ50_06415 [Spirochaetales bacterium]|nr:hypothetical protein [Spirochaetales bacterium]